MKLVDNILQQISEANLSSAEIINLIGDIMYSIGASLDDKTDSLTLEELSEQFQPEQATYGQVLMLAAAMLKHSVELQTGDNSE